jgi:ubiquinone/menaquinone biosynthesis C-methylase UbiE
VLDIATGAGRTALAVAPYVAHVIATDITSQMLDQARRLAGEQGLSNITVETADAEALPYDDGCFDLGTCRIAPHHFTDIPLFLRESLRVLRPGDLFSLVANIVPPGSAGDYINAFEKLRDPSHGRCLSIDE